VAFELSLRELVSRFNEMNLRTLFSYQLFCTTRTLGSHLTFEVGFVDAPARAVCSVLRLKLHAKSA